ncbi:hypothetical protein SASPL_115577 [Salvia splendens]|uniref:Uncharacterized protein n=1 Tax=Salvia splendens TaxID=180675 RepID=A0A8X8Y2S0_SALSN|nr:hypothetical protein SASPL_115577 [Salvia splendens]
MPLGPRARLAVYKGGSRVSSDVLAAMDQAVADGVDILSISLGVLEINLYESPLSIASFGAREKGIMICTSAGNRGQGSRTIRSGIPWAVIIASGTVDLADYALSSATPTRASISNKPFSGKSQEPRQLSQVTRRDARGLNYEGILKPDLMAPGVLILAAFHPQLMAASIGRNIDLATDYNLLAGPHISGVVAVLKAAHPEWSPAMIQSAMMTTSNPLDNTNQPIRAHDGSVATPFGIGLGHVDLGLVYGASLQDLVNLVCSMNFTRNQTQTIIRSSNNCSNPSSDLNYPSFVALIRAAEIGRTLTRRFRRSVTNVGDAATYRVMVEAPVNTTVVVRPQTLVFKKKYETTSYSLTIQYNADIRIQHREGAVIWIDQAGKYRVRSPIMVAAAADNFE